MDENQLLAELRRRDQQVKARITALRADPSRHEEWKAGEIQRIRAAALAEARSFMLHSGVERDIAQRREAMVQWLPRRPDDTTVAEKIASAELTRRKPEQRPDVVRLSRTATSELTRMAERTDDVVLAADVRRELALRGEQGDAAARTGAGIAAHRLHDLAVALPDTRTRQQRFAELSAVAEHLTHVMRAIETGEDDLGVRLERYADIRAQLDAQGVGEGDPLLRAPVDSAAR